MRHSNSQQPQRCVCQIRGQIPTHTGARTTDYRPIRMRSGLRGLILTALLISGTSALSSAWAGNPSIQNLKIKCIGESISVARNYGLQIARTIGEVVESSIIGSAQKVHGSFVFDLAVRVNATAPLSGAAFEKGVAEQFGCLVSVIDFHAGFIEGGDAPVVEVVVVINPERVRAAMVAATAYFEHHVAPEKKGLVLARSVKASVDEATIIRKSLGIHAGSIHRLKPVWLDIKEVDAHCTVCIAAEGACRGLTAFRTYQITDVVLPPVFPPRLIVRFLDPNNSHLGYEPITLAGLAVDSMPINSNEHAGATVVAGISLFAHTKIRHNRFGVIPGVVYVSPPTTTYRIVDSTGKAARVSIEFFAGGSVLHASMPNRPSVIPTGLKLQPPTAIVEILDAPASQTEVFSR